MWEKWQKQKRKVKKTKQKPERAPKTPLVYVAHVLLCCVATTSTAPYVVTQLFLFSVQKLSSRIFSIFETWTKKNKHTTKKKQNTQPNWGSRKKYLGSKKKTSTNFARSKRRVVLSFPPWSRRSMTNIKACSQNKSIVGAKRGEISDNLAPAVVAMVLPVPINLN